MKIRILVLISLFIIAVSNCAIAGELEERKVITKQVIALLNNENYKELEKLSQEYRVKKSRTSSGIWNLTLFYSGIEDAANFHTKGENFWSSLKSKTEKWIKEYPKSPTPYISHGIVMREYAWKFRGGRWAYEVPNEAWRPFREHLNNTRNFLEKYKAIANTDPHWYVVRGYVATELSVDRTEFEKILDEGLRKEPLYYQLYFVAVRYFAPKWHGNKRDIEEFANSSVERTKEQEGLGMYTRIYWSASQTQYDEKLFTDSDVVWEKMKRGIDDVLRRYPDQWNINNFALFACLAQDKRKARELFGQIKGPPIIEVWESDSAYLRYRAWAYEQ